MSLCVLSLGSPKAQIQAWAYSQSPVWLHADKKIFQLGHQKFIKFELKGRANINLQNFEIFPQHLQEENND